MLDEDLYQLLMICNWRLTIFRKAFFSADVFSLPFYIGIYIQRLRKIKNDAANYVWGKSIELMNLKIVKVSLWRNLANNLKSITIFVTCI